MANRIIGLDIGTSSVKAVVLETAFKGFELLEVFEEPIVDQIDEDELVEETEGDDEGDDAPEQNPEERAAEEQLQRDLNPLSPGTIEALKRLVDRGALAGDGVVMHLSEGVYTVAAELPFSDPAQIRLTLPPQLEGRLPESVDDLHLDFMVTGTTEAGHSHIQAAAVRPARMAGLLGVLDEVGIDPKVLDLAPYHLLTASKALGVVAGTHAIIDIGAQRTSVLVITDGNVEFARSFPGGGERIVEELADTFRLELDVAREGMHAQGFIDAGAREDQPDASTGEDARDISNAVRRGVKPLIRQLRRTFHAHQRQSSNEVAEIYLCGGPSQMPGLADYIGQSIGVPARTFDLTQSEFASVEGFAQHGHRYIGALGLALHLIPSHAASHFNFRRGPYAFRGSYEHLRMRLPAILATAAAILVAGVLMVTAKIVLLNAESKELESALRDVSTEVFGTSLSSASQIQSRLDAPREVSRVVPEVSAYEIFADIGLVIGELADEENEIEARAVEVNMQRGIFEIEGYVSSAQTVDELHERLGSVQCLRNIQAGDIDRDRRSERLEFNISGAAICQSDEDESGEQADE